MILEDRQDKDLAFMLKFENVAWYEDGKVRILDRRIYPIRTEFPFSYGSDGVQILQQGDYYYVKGWVDAENSFGAMIRNDFVVTMYQDGEFMTAEDCVMKER